MGYYTQFSLDIIEGYEDSIIPSFRDRYESAEYALDEEGCYNHESKWFNYEDELKEFSLDYPNCLFLLEGIGESGVDFWRLYVKNGKSFFTEAEIVFEEYKENKLI